ncbi:hypothetical protein [Actinopolymorpha pittospori]
MRSKGSEAFGVKIAAIVLAAGLASAGLQGVLLPLLRRYVVDVPNDRSSHRFPTARGGGLGVVGGIWLGTVAGWMAGLPVAWSIALLALGLAAALGLTDDVRSVRAMIRLIVQLSLGSALALLVLGSETDLRGLAFALAVFVGAIWIAGFTNAFNFMDGINGISALNALVAGGWYAYVGWYWDVNQVMTLGLAIAGAAAGFLPWNLPRARVFMGDVGAYAVGMSLAGLAMWSATAGVPLWSAFAPLVIYTIDTGWTLARRVMRGRPWREAHREHVYQRLVDGGWSHTKVAVLSAVAALASCAIATVANDVGVIIGSLLLAIGAACYLLLPQAIHGGDAGVRQRSGSWPGSDAFGGPDSRPPAPPTQPRSPVAATPSRSNPAIATATAMRRRSAPR